MAASLCFDNVAMLEELGSARGEGRSRRKGDRGALVFTKEKYAATARVAPPEPGVPTKSRTP